MIPGILITVILVATALAVNSFQQRRKHAHIPARFSDLTCTKHAIVKSIIPGGPDHRAWIYGPHRTRGNACDGGKHIRRTPWY